VRGGDTLTKHGLKTGEQEEEEEETEEARLFEGTLLKHRAAECRAINKQYCIDGKTIDRTERVRFKYSTPNRLCL